MTPREVCVIREDFLLRTLLRASRDTIVSSWPPPREHHARRSSSFQTYISAATSTIVLRLGPRRADRSGSTRTSSRSSATTPRAGALRASAGERHRGRLHRLHRDRDRGRRCPRRSSTPMPNEEELAHGLGNSSDHARAKLQRVAERHTEVLAAIAEFVAKGHALTMVHGNHDIEFHWDAVRTEFREILAPPGDHRSSARSTRARSWRGSSSTRGSSGPTASRTSSTATSTTRSARPTT